MYLRTKYIQFMYDTYACDLVPSPAVYEPIKFAPYSPGNLFIGVRNGAAN